LGAIIQACAWENQHISLLAEELPAQALDLQKADLVIRLGEPRSMPAFSAPLGWDDLVLVVHPANPLTVINSGQIRQIFTGNVQQWIDSEETIQVWDYPAGNELQEIFHSALSVGEARYSLAHLAPNPAAMLEAIGGDPTAIGYIPRSWLSPAVKEVTIEGQISESLHQPVLALADKEPGGAVRDFLACLQSYY
jgi:phosphate transport system substrate-binding protein